MFKLVYGDEKFRNVVHLLSQGSPVDVHRGAELLKKIRTRVAIRAAMKETGSPSTHALERFVATKRGFEFSNLNKSRAFERLLTRGSPALDDIGRWPMDGPKKGQSMDDYLKTTNLRTRNAGIMEVGWALENIGSMWETLKHPILELLRIELPPTKRLNQLRQEFSFPELDVSHPFAKHARVVFVMLKEGMQGRSQDSGLYFLTRAVLQLRLAERSGNLPQFTACLAGLASIRIPVVGEMNPILRELSTALGTHVRSVFSHVRLVGLSDHAIAIARGRLEREGISLIRLATPSGEFPPGQREFIGVPSWPELFEQQALDSRAHNP